MGAANMRVHWTNDKTGAEVFGLCFSADALVSDIQLVIESRTGVPVDNQRVIFGGRELDPTKTLEELNVHPKEMVYLLPRLAHVCREWAATGFCSRGRRCYQKKTHTVEYSPRYVEHHAKTASLAGMPKPAAPCQPGSTSDTADPSRVPTPPIQPRPPSYGKLGGARAVARPAVARPAYGALTKAVGETTEGGAAPDTWARPVAAVVRGAAPQQSNSGDWDRIVNDIACAVEHAEDASLLVEEEIDIVSMDEKTWEERSWEEAAVLATIAPMGFGAKYEYDSSYSESSTASVASLCESLAEDPLDLGKPAWTVGSVGSEGSSSDGSIHEHMAMRGAGVGEQNPAAPCEGSRAGGVESAAVLHERLSQGVGGCDIDTHKPPEVDKNAAALEFSAGVHLIDEMENQVKQWEEDEAAREKAYEVFVSQRMAAAAAMAGKGATAAAASSSSSGAACGQPQHIRIF